MKNYLKPTIIITVFLMQLIVSGVFALPEKKLFITDFGYQPGSRQNVVPAVKEALKACAEYDSAILVFPKGRYDFWQDFSSESRFTTGIHLDGLKNFILDGDGSEFIFHGNMQILNINGCQDIRVQNFSADWDEPFMIQGQYVNATDDYIDLQFDLRQYRYLIEDGKFYLVGEGWKALPTGYFDLFDRDTKEILYQSHDANNAEVFTGLAQEIAPGTVRFHGKTNIKPEKGTYTILMAGRYLTTGIDIAWSKNVYLKDITVYHALSHGVFGRNSENITMDNASMKVNEKKGRVFSIIADASHFKDCRGLIKVVNCAHTGAMDDFINVQGSYMKVDSILNVSVFLLHGSVSPGDEVWFVNPDDCQRSVVRTVLAAQVTGRTGKGPVSAVTLTETLPEGVQAGSYVENKSWTPEVEIRDCKILKQNRARGILFTTPKKVVIENNYFRSAGTAILIEGDMDHWYESGANRNVSIRNNVFEDCLTSGCITGNRWEWGEAIITITPSHRPQHEQSEPYHQNISIENNVFKTFDVPLVHARSVGGLIFKDNEIIRTFSFEPYLWQKSSFLLDGCRQVVISGNKIDPQYMVRTIEAEHMSKSDIRAEGFKINIF